MKKMLSFFCYHHPQIESLRNDYSPREMFFRSFSFTWMTQKLTKRNKFATTLYMKSSTESETRETNNPPRGNLRSRIWDSNSTPKPTTEFID